MNIDQIINRRDKDQGYGVVDCANCDGGAQAVPVPRDDGYDSWSHTSSMYGGMVADYGPLGIFQARSIARRINAVAYANRNM